MAGPLRPFPSNKSLPVTGGAESAAEGTQNQSVCIQTRHARPVHMRESSGSFK